MIADHHARSTKRATLLVRAVDGVLGTHSLITVTDREGVVLSSGACTGMPPAVGCPVTYLNDMGGSSRAHSPSGSAQRGSRHYPAPSQRVTVIAATGQSLMPRP